MEMMGFGGEGWGEEGVVGKPYTLTSLQLYKLHSLCDTSRIAPSFPYHAIVLTDCPLTARDVTTHSFSPARLDQISSRRHIRGQAGLTKRKNKRQSFACWFRN